MIGAWRVAAAAAGVVADDGVGAADVAADVAEDDDVADVADVAAAAAAEDDDVAVVVDVDNTSVLPYVCCLQQRNSAVTSPDELESGWVRNWNETAAQKAEDNIAVAGCPNNYWCPQGSYCQPDSECRSCCCSIPVESGHHPFQKHGSVLPSLVFEKKNLQSDHCLQDPRHRLQIPGSFSFWIKPVSRLLG